MERDSLPLTGEPLAPAPDTQEQDGTAPLFPDAATYTDPGAATIATPDPAPSLGPGEPAPDPTHDVQPPPEMRHDPVYGPIPLRYRHDGWVPDRQMAFIQALADCGCVEEAARRVGMSRASAYALRRRPDAQAFRLAWDFALDQAVERLAEVALGRAMNGVAIPIFHQGEQVGERRHFDERLTMFLLRTRYSARFDRKVDPTAKPEVDDPDARVDGFNFRIGRMVRAAWRSFTAAHDNQPAPPPEIEPTTYADFRFLLTGRD